MSVSPRTVPQDTISADFSMNGAGPRHEAFGNALSFYPSHGLGERASQDKFQNTGISYNNSMSTTTNTNDTFSTTAVTSPMCSSKTKNVVCTEFSSRKLDLTTIPHVEETSSGICFNQSIWLTPAKDFMSTPQQCRFDHTTEATSTDPFLSITKSRCRSLPDSALPWEAETHTCAISRGASQVELIGHLSVAALPSQTCLPPEICGSNPSVSSKKFSFALISEDASKRTASRAETNLKSSAHDADDRVHTSSFTSLCPTTQNEKNSHLMDSRTSVEKGSTFSDNDDVQLLFTAPRRPRGEKIRKRRKVIRRVISSIEQPTASRDYRYHCSASKGNDLSLCDAVTDIPSQDRFPLSHETADRQIFKEEERERLPEVDKSDPWRSNLPATTLDCGNSRKASLDTPLNSTQKTISAIANKPATEKSAAPPQEHSLLQSSTRTTSSIHTEHQLQAKKPARGRPKKDAATTQPKKPPSSKSSQPQNHSKSTSNLNDMEKPRKRRKLATPNNKDAQPPPKIDDSELSTGSFKQISNHGAHYEESSMSTPSVGNYYQTPSTSIPWQHPNLPGGFFPPFTFPGSFNYDWQQQTAHLYAQMYQNMQQTSQTSQQPQQPQQPQSQQDPQAMYSRQQQGQQQGGWLQFSNKKKDVSKDVLPAHLTSNFPRPGADYRKSSLYSVPTWSSSPADMTNKASSPIHQGWPQANHSSLLSLQQAPDKSLSSSSRDIQTPIQQPSVSRSHPQTPRELPNITPQPLTHSSNMIVDIAQTCQEIFPFEKIAEKHNKSLQEVYDGFSAIIQIPLLRSAVDNKRAEALASMRMNEFREIRRGVSELHEKELKKQEATRKQAENNHIQPTMSQRQVPHGFHQYAFPNGLFLPGKGTQ